MNRSLLTAVLALLIVALIALVYWPVAHAGLIWDDKVIFRDHAWLRVGDSWKHFLFQDFFDWKDFFRPLAVALFTFEARALDSFSGSMHLVSLSMHLANTLLIGLLAWNLLAGSVAAARAMILAGMAMLLYGLHPALVEPVVWISCQAELLLTFFVMCGMLCNVALQQAWLRATCVGACFFLAACCKESAVSFPLLLLVLDWMHAHDISAGTVDSLRALWLRQRPVYAAVLTAGVAYLTLRYWGLGMLVHPAAHEPFFTFGRLQTVCFIYLAYWRILVWPMQGLGPLHEVNAQQFAVPNSGLLAIDAAAVAILFAGAYLAYRRRAAGCLVLAVSAALLPVLHVVPIAFDGSLYHERYAMTALAMACAILPVVIADAQAATFSRLLPALFAPVFAVWITLAWVNIRVTLPLWSDETRLWQWALHEHPDSITAKDHLLSTYVETNDFDRARQLADALLAENTLCATCIINAANLALGQGDIARASAALERARSLRSLAGQQRLLQDFILANGRLLELKGDLEAAQDAYHDAIAIEPMYPEAQMNMALLLARRGRFEEARQTGERALQLFAPDEREQRRQALERALAAAAAARAPSEQPQ